MAPLQIRRIRAILLALATLPWQAVLSGALARTPQCHAAPEAAVCGVSCPMKGQRPIQPSEQETGPACHRLPESPEEERGCLIVASCDGNHALDVGTPQQPWLLAGAAGVSAPELAISRSERVWPAARPALAVPPDPPPQLPVP